jgi:toxin FitB
LKFLLDTLVISETLRPRPEKKVLAWLDSTEDDLLALSVLTIGELEKGVAKLYVGPRRTKLVRWIEDDLRSMFEGRILPVTHEVASVWGQLSGQAEAEGMKIPVIDALLGATALVHGLTVVTRNTSDIARTGAAVFNPWES